VIYEHKFFDMLEIK